MSEERPEYIADDTLEEEDVATTPAPNADHPDEYLPYVREELTESYEIYSYRHACAILATSFKQEFEELQQALLAFRISRREIGMPGGSESEIPKKLARALRPKDWLEARVQGDLVVRMQKYDEIEVRNKITKVKRSEPESRVIPNFIDGHKIDFVKGRVAFDVEWNSKDQTFDRDLYAFRAFHECGLIGAGVMLTRGTSMTPVFSDVQKLDKNGAPIFHKDGKRAGQPMSVKAKYGASTTWMGKLLYRLNAGRHGGCPVLAFGITPKLIDDGASTE